MLGRTHFLWQFFPLNWLNVERSSWATLKREDENAMRIIRLVTLSLVSSQWSNFFTELTRRQTRSPVFYHRGSEIVRTYKPSFKYVLCYYLHKSLPKWTVHNILDFFLRRCSHFMYSQVVWWKRGKKVKDL